MYRYFAYLDIELAILGSNVLVYFTVGLRKSDTISPFSIMCQMQKEILLSCFFCLLTSKFITFCVKGLHWAYGTEYDVAIILVAITGTKSRNQSKLEKTRKLWYIFLCKFLLLLPRFYFWGGYWARCYFSTHNLRFSYYLLIS